MKHIITFIFCIYSIVVFGQFQAQQTEFQPISFQSTSTLPHSGSSYSSTPTINEYGIATYNETTHYTPNKVGPRKTPGTPGPGNPEYQQPIGDTPVIFIIILIGLYIGYRKWKRLNSLPF